MIRTFKAQDRVTFNHKQFGTITKVDGDWLLVKWDKADHGTAWEKMDELTLLPSGKKSCKCCGVNWHEVGY